MITGYPAATQRQIDGVKMAPRHAKWPALFRLTLALRRLVIRAKLAKLAIDIDLLNMQFDLIPEALHQAERQHKKLTIALAEISEIRVQA